MDDKDAQVLLRKKRNARGRELMYFRRGKQEDGVRNIKWAVMHGRTAKIPSHFAQDSRKRFRRNQNKRKHTRDP